MEDEQRIKLTSRLVKAMFHLEEKLLASECADERDFGEICISGHLSSVISIIIAHLDPEDFHGAKEHTLAYFRKMFDKAIEEFKEGE